MATTILAKSLSLIASGDLNGNIWVSDNSSVLVGLQVYMTDNQGAQLTYLAAGVGVGGQVTLSDVSGRPVSASRWLVINRASLNWTTQTLTGALPRGTANKIVTGLQVHPPATPSTQGSGAVAPVVSVDYDAGIGCFNGVLAEDQSATVAASIASAPVLTVGQSAVASLFLWNSSGTPTLLTAWGVAATTGSQVAPDRVAVASANSSKNLVLLATTTVNRTGDTTITQTTNNTVRDF